jgi:hypothetical protein
VEGSCERGNDPSSSIKCWELPSGCTTCGLSSGIQLHRVSWSVGRRSVSHLAGFIYIYIYIYIYG